MNPIQAWGLDVIMAVQHWRGPALDFFFKGITQLGNEDFMLLLLPLILWCFDFVQGARMGVFLVLSGYLNFLLKEWIAAPRPFQLEPGVKVIEASGYGMPSGHAQLAVVIWGFFAAWIRKAWGWVVAGALILLIGFSRIYLGVHFPQQVLVGWLIGGALLAIYLGFAERLEAWVHAQRLGYQLLICFGVSVVLIVLNPTADSVVTAALFLGATCGMAVAQQIGGFSTAGPAWQRALRFIVGAALLLAIREGLKWLFPGEGEPLYIVLRGVRYTLVGLWMTLGAPWFFRRVRLAPKV
ncbi:MAG: phosphatase PAP2 family protein [Anaerolineae bacterium]|nr:phosphatase PAP2 family protein [Anaerolineae bacterium]